jgi:gamma-glutamylcyclotransferase
MKTIKKLYFAYGSNMNQERLESRVGKVSKIGVIKLPYWKLEFNCGPGSQRFANITMTGNRKDAVEGVLYELTPKQFRILDGREGCPFVYQKMAVPLKDGKTMFAYICVNPLYRPLPKAKASAEYMSHLLKGCKENGLVKTMKLLLSLKKAGTVQFDS